MTQNEVNKNLKEKEGVLNWLMKNKIRSLDEFGKVMNYYYSDKELLLKEIKQNNVKLFKVVGNERKK